MNARTSSVVQCAGNTPPANKMCGDAEHSISNFTVGPEQFALSHSLISQVCNTHGALYKGSVVSD